MKTHRNQSGFTLTEVVVAAAISSVLILVIMTQSTNLFRTQMFAETRSNLYQDNVLLANYFRRVIAGIGGGSVQPYMAAYVEDNLTSACNPRWGMPDCTNGAGASNSDRLTLISTPTPPLECSILGNSTSTTVNIFNSSGTACCLAADPRWSSGTQLLLSVNGYYAQVYASAANVDTSAAGCTITFVAGPASPNNYLPPGTPPDWSNGVVSLVTVTTYYWDATTNKLMQYIDVHNTQDITQATVVAENIFDFQADLGYLKTSATTAVTDNGTNTDSTLYNSGTSVATAEQFGVGPFVSTQLSGLRLIGVGYMNGMPNNWTATQALGPQQIFDGPQRSSPGQVYNSIIIKVAPKNLGLL